MKSKSFLLYSKVTSDSLNQKLSAPSLNRQQLAAYCRATVVRSMSTSCPTPSVNCFKPPKSISSTQKWIEIDVHWIFSAPVWGPQKNNSWLSAGFHWLEKKQKTLSQHNSTSVCRFNENQREYRGKMWFPPRHSLSTLTAILLYIRASSVLTSLYIIILQ